MTSQSKVESAFGESWASKKDRLLGERLQGDEADGRERLKRHGSSYWPLRDLRCFIIKSNDDLRQEVGTSLHYITTHTTYLHYLARWVALILPSFRCAACS